MNNDPKYNMNNETIGIQELRNEQLAFTSLIMAAGMALGEAHIHQIEDPARTAMIGIAKFCMKSANDNLFDYMMAKGFFD